MYYGLTDESNVNTARGQGSALRSPSKSIFQNPSIELVFRLLGEAEVWSSNALQDVVVVFCRAEYARRWVWYIPSQKSQVTSQHPLT